MKLQFEGQLSPGHDLKLNLPDGSTVEARMEYDENSFLPWEMGDCNGVVSDWRDVDSKRPGERILCGRGRGGNSERVRFYDVPATMEKQKTVWGEATPRDGETQRQANARALKRTFNTCARSARSVELLRRHPEAHEERRLRKGRHREPVGRGVRRPLRRQLSDDGRERDCSTRAASWTTKRWAHDRARPLRSLRGRVRVANQAGPRPHLLAHDARLFITHRRRETGATARRFQAGGLTHEHR